MQEQIRFVTFNDIPRILEIYTPYITDTTISFEYEPPSLEEFTARVQTTSSKYPYLVYERDSVILGFAYGSPYQERIAYNFDADLSVYLAPEAQKGGIGRKLYTCLLDLRKNRAFTMFTPASQPPISAVSISTSRWVSVIWGRIRGPWL